MAVKFEKISDKSYLLDVRGYVCPHPQMYTKKAMEKIPSDTILKVILDNPSSSEGIHELAKVEGYEILEYSEDQGIFTFLLKKVKQ